MGTSRQNRPVANDRSMEAVEDSSELFFFPKKSPPVTVRAASREEAERLADEQSGDLQDDTNRKEV